MAESPSFDIAATPLGIPLRDLSDSSVDSATVTRPSWSCLTAARSIKPDLADRAGDCEFEDYSGNHEFFSDLPDKNGRLVQGTRSYRGGPRERSVPFRGQNQHAASLPVRQSQPVSSVEADFFVGLVSFSTPSAPSVPWLYMGGFGDDRGLDCNGSRRRDRRCSGGP